MNQIIEEYQEELQENVPTTANNICKNCGFEFELEYPYCPKCGKKAAVSKNTNKEKIIAGVLLALFVVLASALVIYGFTYSNTSSSFEKLFADYSSEIWCEIAKDDSYITIDTNYFNIDEYSNSDAVAAIEKINKELGFSESVFKKMKSTSALDGRQETENKNFAVSWTYHPDNGLEVIYERK